MKNILTIFILAVVVFAPEAAYAWGPGVHLALGNSVLGNLGCLPPLVGGLLACHKNAFLYGCLSADIFIGKGTTFRPGHSHNWVTGFKLLQSAKDPRVTAYAYGYLSHLAADVVAHNYYVPNALWRMSSGGKISHVYVEARADSRFEEERELALRLFKHPNRDTDSTLLSAMERRKLPFLLKKQIVKGSLRVTGSKEWGHSLRFVDNLLPWPQKTSDLDEMVNLSRNLVFEFLSDPKASSAVSFDPIGSRNLRVVREMRSRNRRRKDKSFLFQPHAILAGIAAPCPVDSTAAVAGASG